MTTGNTQITRNTHGAFNPILGAAAGFAATVLLVGGLPRVAQHMELSRVHQQLSNAVPEVSATVVQPADKKTTLVLPGDMQPIQNIPIFARANGYLLRRYVDIGDNVKAGQLLGEISTPELDQQVSQAEAGLRMAEANLASSLAERETAAAQLFAADATITQNKTNLEYATTELKRYQDLASQGAVTYEQRDKALQEFNSDTAAIQVAEQNRRAQVAQVTAASSRIAANKQSIKSAEASVEQLKALQGFQKVVAPADGVITNRLVDAGALVAAGGSSGTTELLTMAKTDALRIYVSVPQTDYRYIHSGDKADILLQEFPGQVFTGKVTNIAGSLSSDSRTSQTEIRIDNSKHMLKPGSYADVRFVYNNQTPPEVIPSSAAITKQDGLYVAIVDGGKLRYRKIEVSRDLGNKMEISQGLKPNDVVIIDVPDGLNEGSAVKANIVHS
ncbi:MAG TPA: efflux RND transporter periplasmic adaptor subunit [Planktothrix sp.]